MITIFLLGLVLAGLLGLYDELRSARRPRQTQPAPAAYMLPARHAALHLAHWYDERPTFPEVHRG